MVKNILFQLHWFFGITAGLILAIVGVTGGILSFEDDILEWMNPGVLTVEAPSGKELLTPQQLIDAFKATAPDARINSVSVSSDFEASATVGIAPASGQGRGEQRLVDPYTGKALGKPAGQEFFRTVMQLHRWLVMPGGNQSIGKQIVGVSTIILIYFAISGIYLRWPRRALDWRAWLMLDFSKRGRSLYWSLHSVIGVWVLIAYLIMSLTGLWWSFDWYRNAASLLLTGKPVQTQNQGGPPGGGRGGAQEAPPPPPVISLDPAWQGFLKESGGQYQTATFTLPRKEGDPVQVRYIPADAQHDRAADQVKLDPATGAVLSHERFTDKTFGEQIYGSVFPLHSGAYFGVVGVILWMVASLMMPLFFVTGWLLYLDRRKKKGLARRAAAEAGSIAAIATADATLIAFASQTGFAESLAWRTAAAFKAGGRPFTVRALGSLTKDDLAKYRQALFVVSTFGEGEPPDNGRAFDRKVMGQAAALPDLSYAVLALGDNTYRDTFAFGRALDAWLHRSAAKRLFDTVEVDQADDAALRHWQHHVGLLAGTDLPDWTPPEYENWTLAERRHLNPGSAGGEAWLIRLTPPAATPDWQAGDIAEIGPAPETEGEARPPHREYSIASLPADGGVELVVRLMTRPDGTPGLGSGWLIRRASVGGAIEMRLRANPSFHATHDGPAILIGNGTGIAGLRAHLKARAAKGLKEAWLIFGERNADRDAFFADEIAAWQADGTLGKVDLVYSRDQAEKRYVQDALREEGETVKAWIDRGAAIYVCGSLEGMAPSVEAALAELVDTDALDALAAEGRYRRDVY